MSSVLFLFLAHLGLGIAATLLLVKREAGVQFFRFNAGLGAVLLLIALAFRPEFVDGGQTSSLGFVALVIATGALLLYWATVGRAGLRGVCFEPLPGVDLSFFYYLSFFFLLCSSYFFSLLLSFLSCACI